MFDLDRGQMMDKLTFVGKESLRERIGKPREQEKVHFGSVQYLRELEEKTKGKVKLF